MKSDSLNRSVDLYRRMYLIRRAEEEIKARYLEDEMKTPMHMSTGAEAIAAGVCGALQPDDQVIGTYRSHAIYLAKTLESDGFFGEMYGRATGVAKGKGGSMHLIAPEHGLICTSAIVASSIPVALGAAYANRQAGNGKVVAVFFGDGAIDEGAFWESLNSACQMKLPVLFVCEDNGYAVHNQKQYRHGYQSITDVVRRFRLQVSESDTTDVEQIQSLTRDMLQQMAHEGMPGFLHLHYYRYLEHVGVFEDFNKGYRNREEMEPWLERDPVQLQRERLLGVMSGNELASIEQQIDEQVLASVEAARSAPFPGDDELLKDIFA